MVLPWICRSNISSVAELKKYFDRIFVIEIVLDKLTQIDKCQKRKPLTIITKRSILDGAAALDPPLNTTSQFLIKSHNVTY